MIPTGTITDEITAAADTSGQAIATLDAEQFSRIIDAVAVGATWTLPGTFTPAAFVHVGTINAPFLAGTSAGQGDSGTGSISLPAGMPLTIRWTGVPVLGQCRATVRWHASDLPGGTFSFTSPLTAQQLQAELVGTPNVSISGTANVQTQSGSVASPEWIARDSTYRSVTGQIPAVAGAGSGGGIGLIYQVGSRLTTIIHFTPVGQNQLLFMTWYNDNLKDVVVGQLLFNVKAGQALDYVTFNRSPYLEIVAVVAVAGAGTYGLDVFSTDRPMQPGTYFRSTAYDGVILDTGTITLPAGTSATADFIAPFTGPAAIAFSNISGAQGKCTLVGTDYQGFVVECFVTVASISQQIYIPPRINQVRIDNIGAANGTYKATVLSLIGR